MEAIPTTAYGGYFELPLSKFDNFPHKSALHLQSARACLRYYLLNANFRKIYVPKYCCPSVLEALGNLDIEIGFFHVGQDFSPLLNNFCEPDACVLVVNYFGICDDIISEVSLLCENLIVDNSHALFSKFDSACCNIYSPRKYSGLPDGGILLSNLGHLREPPTADKGSLSRCSHLLIRAADGPESGFAHFKKNRRSIPVTPRSMSSLTRRLLQHIDWRQCLTQRSKNFGEVDRAFGKFNDLRFESIPISPFFYPLFLKNRDVDKIRQRLILKKIYIPTFWSDIPESELSCDERLLRSNILMIPIDQRYCVSDIQRIISIICKELN